MGILDTPPKTKPQPRIYFFGHSYLEGLPSVAPNQALRLASLTAGLLNARESTSAVHGSSIYWAGDTLPTIERVWRDVTPRGALPLRPALHAGVIYAGINDIQWQKTYTDNSIVINALRVAIDRLRAGAAWAPFDTTTIVFAQGTGAGNWANGGGNSFAYGSNRISTNAGNKFTITTPSTFLGGTLDIVVFNRLNGGAVHSITVDGGGAQTFDTRTGLVSSYRPVRIRLTGLSAGSHTIVDTLTTVGSDGEYFCYWQIPHPTPPVVALASINRCPINPNFGDHVLSTADYTTWNGLFQALVAEYTDGRVLYVDTDTALGNDATLFNADGLHPNADGNAALAQLFARTLRPYMPGDVAYTQSQAAGINGLFNPQLNSQGLAPMAGSATLVAGTVRVTTRAMVATTSGVLVTRQNTNANEGTLKVTTKTANSGSVSGFFDIVSTNASDTGQVFWTVWPVI